MRFSVSSQSFYPENISYPDLPGELVELSDDQHSALINLPHGSTFDFVDGKFVIYAQPAQTLNEIKAEKLAALTIAFSARMAAIKAGYPPDEIQSWFDQKGEAVSFTADKGAPTPLLSAMAAARGITVADLAGRILANAQAYSAAAGALIGTRQKYEDAVNNAVDAAAVAAISWTD